MMQTPYEHKIFSRFDPTGKEQLGDLAMRLLEEQKNTWPMCGTGYASLDAVQIKEIQCNGYDIKVQFNPKRIVSSAAKVDPKSIAERKCFLCVPHLPGEQKGVLVEQDGERFLVLCNPMPIFRAHYTISHVDHRPQEIEPFLETMMLFARWLAPRFSVFYNGPKCGASAPDHMHFQAAPKSGIPIEIETQKPDRRHVIRDSGSGKTLLLKNLGRTIVVAESADPLETASIVRDILFRLQEVQHGHAEPLINLIATRDDDGMTRAILFPRSKHRPDVFFKEGDEKLLISPAAVDIGGLVVTPLEHDFHRVNAHLMESIFFEVSLDQTLVESVL